MADVVLDSSAALAWVMNEPGAPTVRVILDQVGEDYIHTPGHFAIEVINALLANERQGRLLAAETSAAVDLVIDLRLQVDDSLPPTLTLDLARRHRLTAYDAAYLELAVRYQFPLATFDRALRRAAAVEGVRLLVPEGV